MIWLLVQAVEEAITSLVKTSSLGKTGATFLIGVSLCVYMCFWTHAGTLDTNTYIQDVFVYSCQLCRVCDLEHGAPQWPSVRQVSSLPMYLCPALGRAPQVPLSS